MSSTFDSTSYRSDLDRLSFSDEQKAHMAARLAETASDRTAEAKEARENGTGKILELHGARAAHSAVEVRAPPQARRGRAQRIAAALGIAAMLTIGGGTAYATGTLARAADSLAAVFGAGPAQTELIDRIGRPIGASCTSNGITITADAIIGMRHAYAVVYTIEKDDGTAFDEITMNENGHYNLFLEGGGSINALTALRLGVQGGHGGAYTFDADPSDNAIQLMEMMSLTGTDASLRARRCTSTPASSSTPPGRTGRRTRLAGGDAGDGQLEHVVQDRLRRSVCRPARGTELHRKRPQRCRG